jgi:hypothetical protein
VLLYETLRERIHPTPKGLNRLKIFGIFSLLLVGFLLQYL